MAAVLIEIKSRLLLPRPPAAEDGEARPARRARPPPARVRADEGGGASVDALPRAERDFALVRVWFEQTAVAAPAGRLRRRRPRDRVAALLARARINRHHLVTREQLSVRAQMSRMLRRSGRRRATPSSRRCSPTARRRTARRDLSRAARARARGARRLTQAEPYAPIYVRLAGMPRSRIRILIRDPGRHKMLSLAEVKTVLETALLIEPGAAGDRRLAQAVRPRLGARHGPQAARRAARGLAGKRRARAGRDRLALPGATGGPALPRPARRREAAALLARGDGNARDHRLPATRDPRRHRSHPRRHRVDEHRQDARGPANGSTSSAIARRRAARRCTRRPSASSTISACARCRSFRPLKKSPRASNSRSQEPGRRTRPTRRPAVAPPEDDEHAPPAIASAA